MYFDVFYFFLFASLLQMFNLSTFGDCFQSVRIDASFPGNGWALAPMYLSVSTLIFITVYLFND